MLFNHLTIVAVIPLFPQVKSNLKTSLFMSSSDSPPAPQILTCIDFQWPWALRCGHLKVLEPIWKQTHNRKGIKKAHLKKIIIKKAHLFSLRKVAKAPRVAERQDSKAAVSVRMCYWDPNSSQCFTPDTAFLLHCLARGRHMTPFRTDVTISKMRTENQK